MFEHWGFAGCSDLAIVKDCIVQAGHEWRRAENVRKEYLSIHCHKPSRMPLSARRAAAKVPRIVCRALLRKASKSGRDRGHLKNLEENVRLTREW